MFVLICFEMIHFRLFVGVKRSLIFVFCCVRHFEWISKKQYVYLAIYPISGMRYYTTNKSIYDFLHVFSRKFK